MTATTIKVDSVVRDRLAEVARARGVTMGVLLDAESRRLAAEQRWLVIEESCARLATDPAEWADYEAELDRWDLATSSPDPSAQEEWPDLARPQ